MCMLLAETRILFSYFVTSLRHAGSTAPPSSHRFEPVLDVQFGHGICQGWKSEKKNKKVFISRAGETKTDKNEEGTERLRRRNE